MRYSDETIAASARLMRKVMDQWERSIEHLSIKMEERRAALAAGKNVSLRQLRLEQDMQAAMNAELVRLQNYMKSDAFRNSFMTEATGLGRAFVPTGYKSAFDAIVASQGTVYRTAMSNLFTREIVGGANGLYSIVPKHLMRKTENVLYSAINEGKTTQALVRELSPIYRQAREARGAARLFSAGGDLGDVGNAYRAALHEVNVAQNYSSLAFAHSEDDIIGVKVNYDDSCDTCQAVFGPTDGEILFENGAFVVPLPVHVRCDCWIEGYIFRGDKVKSSPVDVAGDGTDVKVGKAA